MEEKTEKLLVSHSPKKGPVEHSSLSESSLVNLCRTVIVNNLERYPPEAFGICDEEEWKAIAKIRHDKTQPKEGSGGLDGTGRLVPAISDKFLESLEAANPHLAESAAVDATHWRDCVEYRFKKGGLTRPKSLCFPWPILVEKIQEAANSLKLNELSDNPQADSTTISNAIKTLSKCPMNISLLRDTGVGKTIKKILKNPHPNIDEESLGQLKEMLDSWIALAADSGVDVKKPKKSAAADSSAKNEEEERESLKIAEKCTEWRQLYAVLKSREEARRDALGKKMRENRRNLAATRPKLVKVRPSNPSNNTLGRAAAAQRAASGGWAASNAAAAGGGKLAQVRQEALVQSSRARGKAVSAPRSSFADAVAFASGTAKGKAHRQRKSSTVQLGGNKRMKVPTQVVKGAGPRSFVAKKWNK